MIGTQFVRSFNPIWYFVDLVGKQFDDTFYLWVLTNTVPYIPAPVYHDVNGLIPWTDPIQFLPNGTLPVDIYWDDTQVYRLEIRQNTPPNPPSQADALIYLVENYIPNGAGSTNPMGAGVITDNQITNPQFALFNSNQPIVITTAGTFEIAPGWFLDLTGSGTATITQNALNTTLGNPTNAPYALEILTTGWSNPPVLRQRFAQNGMNWQNKTVASSITARINGASQVILVRLVASTGQVIALLMNPNLTNTFEEYQGNALITTFANLNIPPNAYIDYAITLPQNSDVFLTSIQVTESQTATNVEYMQDTINRQIDHTFNYYEPKLLYKPIPSYLVGWDFPKNPAQLGTAFTAAAFTGANASQYTWDQTILFQSITQSMGVTRSASGDYVITAAANGQVAVIQYLSDADIQDILDGNVSVNVSGFTNQAGGIQGTVSLWVSDGTALPVITGGAKPSLVATLNAQGLPATLNACTSAAVGWTQITANNGLNGHFLLGNARVSAPSQYNDVALNNFGLNNAGALTSATAKFFAIVVGFAQLNMGNTITFNSISCVPGELATRPAPKTIDSTTREANRYYWKTFLPGVVPAANAGLNSGEYIYTSTNTTAGTQPQSSPTLFFPSLMRAAPTIAFFNPTNTGAAGQAFNETRNTVCTATAVVNSSVNGLSMVATPTAGYGIGDLMAAHITADARLGVV